MKLGNKWIGDILFLKLNEAALDASVATEFKNKVLSYLKSGQEKVLLDLSEIEMIDSSGLSALIGIYKSFDNKDHFHIYGLKSNLIRLFEITGMRDLFKFYSSQEEAEQFSS